MSEREINLADEFMPPSVRIGDAEARRLGLMHATAPPPSAAVPDPADVEKAARAMWEADCGPRSYSWDDMSETAHQKWRRLAVAALAAVRPSPDSEAVAQSPCPTCVREGGPYRCCPCSAADPGAHENGQHDHHDLPCSTCVRVALGTGDREGADRG